METNQPGLLGLCSSQNLGLIKVDSKNREGRNNDNNSQTTKTSEELKEEVLQKYAQVCTGLGRLEKPEHTEIDPTVSPVINPLRKIPAAFRERVKAELNDMEKRGVIS